MIAHPPVARIRARRAERVVLSGAMKEPELVIPRLGELGLTESAFGEYVHGLVWRACVGLYDEGRNGGPYSVWFWLAIRGELVELGPHPADWIACVWDEDPTGAWAVSAAIDVLRAAVRREAAHRALEVYRDAMAGSRETVFYERVVASVGQCEPHAPKAVVPRRAQ